MSIGPIIGKCSQFGGALDSGMRDDENLSLYWDHDQCSDRPDLFFLGTSKRLKPSALYLAVRFDPSRKEELRNSKWKVTNPKNGKSCICSLTDWGPNEKTGRCVDLSRGALDAIEATTDSIVEVEMI